MKYTRVTAHFDTKENAKKAERLLNRLGWEDCYNVGSINKKVSIENDIQWTDHTHFTEAKRVKMIKNRRDIVLRLFDTCKGLGYIILVSR